MEIKPYMKALPFPDNRNETFETYADAGWYDESLDGKYAELGLFLGSGGSNQYEDEGILEWWVAGGVEFTGGDFTDITFKPKHEKNITILLKDLMDFFEVPEYEIIWRNRYDEDESDVFITLKPLPADEEKLWKSYWENKRGDKSCSHENLSIKTMEVLNGELLLTLDCDKCGKRTSTSASLNQGWEAEDLNTWAQQELSSHGKNVSFKDFIKKEIKSHGNIDIVDWAKHEKQSHTKKYGAEYENIGTMQSSPASGYNGYMNMMSSARRMVEIGNETGLDQKLGEAYQDESGRWFLPILERKASESFSLDSKKADSINMEEPNEQQGGFKSGDALVMLHLTGLNSTPVGVNEYGEELRRLDEGSQKELMNRIMKKAKQRRSKRGQEEAEQTIKIIKNNDFTFVADYGFSAEEPMVEEPSFIPDGDGRAIGQQNSSINLSPLHAETFEATPKWECDACGDMHDDEDDAESCCIEDCDHTDSEMTSWGHAGQGSDFWMSCNNCGAEGHGTFNRIYWEHDDKTLEHEQTAESFNAESKSMFGKDKNGRMYARRRNGRIITHNAESEAATYSPSSSPDMVNEIQTSPTNESPQLFNASNTFNVTSALGISGLVIAALSLPMLYSSAKSRLGKSAEEKRKASGSVRRNHTQVKNSEYSVGQVNPVEAEGQQDIHGAEGITNPRHAPSASPAGYPSKTLKMW